MNVKQRPLDITSIRADFPILSREVHGRPLVYLDSAATSQKPKSVIEAVSRYYEHSNANVHRGLHTLAEEATSEYEHGRECVARFIGAPDAACVIFTRNTTEAINLVAYAWGERTLNPGDAIVLSQMEHHANLVPWQQTAKRTGAELRWIHVDANGRFDLDSYAEALRAGNVKLVAITHVSNVLGTINPVTEAIRLAREFGAIILLDGAQAAPHVPVNVAELDCDFYALSAHKMLGPTGIGALYGKRHLLEAMEPFQTGGSMISRVTFEQTEWNEIPYKFEAGTPHIAGAVGWAAAVEYLEAIGMENACAHEQHLSEVALKKLRALDGLTLYGPSESNDRVAVFSFNVDGVHPHDVSQVLDEYGIAIRAGHHCCAPLVRLLNTTATARASFYLYNDEGDVDALVNGLREVKRVFRRGA